MDKSFYFWSCLYTILCSLNVQSFVFEGNQYTWHTTTEGTVTKRTIYPVNATDDLWIVRSIYNKTYFKIGWDTFSLETSNYLDDEKTAWFAGYIEGIETHETIYDHWHNIQGCKGKTVCNQAKEYLDKNQDWMVKMVQERSQSDVYWAQVSVFLSQVKGLYEGYTATASENQMISYDDFWWLNTNWDVEELLYALKKEVGQSLRGETHCSAIVKLLSGHSDILVAHNTWSEYETMRRIVKKYTMPMSGVVATSISFSGYPNIIVSGDDFYVTSSGLVTMETTNGNYNVSLWSLLQPQGQVFEVVRSLIANRLADNGKSWHDVFSRYNSGTYNNQWMIIDMKKFSPGNVQPGLLFVLEQIPGYIRGEEQTDLLVSQSYWPSFNRPFYPDIFNMSGNQDLVQEYGDYFTHHKNPRALMFKRDHVKVKDMDSMMRLMRYNDYKSDPLSRCECSPPYSTANAIAARSDLNPKNGTFPFAGLAHMDHGATDAKIVNYEMSKTLSFIAVCGPTTDNDLPAFSWSKARFKHSHRGHPDVFAFQPVLLTWPR